MHNDYIEKQAGPYSYFGKKNIKSPSYQTSLRIMKNWSASVESTIIVQHQHIKSIKKYGAKMQLQFFAKHVDAFFKEQFKIIQIVTDSKLEEKFKALLDNIEKELYGEHVPFSTDISDFANAIDEVTSTRSNVSLPPDLDWEKLASATVAKRRQQTESKTKVSPESSANKEAAPNSGVETKAAALNKILFHKEAFIGKWLGNRYYGDLSRGKNLKSAIEQITQVIITLYTRNKEQYKTLKADLTKGDPDAYLATLKSLAVSTNSVTQGIITSWETHFKKYMTPAATTDAKVAPANDTKVNDETIELNDSDIVPEQTDKKTPPLAPIPAVRQISPGEIQGRKHADDVIGDSEQIEAELLAEEAAKAKAKTDEQAAKEDSVSGALDLDGVKSLIDQNDELGAAAALMLENLFKNAALGNIYDVAQQILLLAEDADNNGDSELASHLTQIAQEAFEDE